MALRALRVLTRREYLNDTPGLEDRPELRYFLRPSDLLPGCRVDLLHGGGETFPAMLAAIRGARRYVHLETYTLRSDATGRRFQRALVERAATGVAVRVIYDGLGSYGIDGDFLRELRTAGVELVEYHPIAPWRQRWGLTRRDHQKLLVVDGEVAFVGGTNIGDEYAPEPEGGGWHDMHARAEGPVVGQVARLFRKTWLRGGGARFREPVIDPGPAGEALAYAIENYGLIRRGRMHRSYRHAIRTAEGFIRIMNAYFIPDRALRRALRHAARRGVRVDVIVPARSDVAVARLASRYLYRSLLRGGVRIHEFQGRMMHAKCGVIDGRWATIGSYNLDARSMFHNLEAGLVILDEPFASRLEREFEEHLARCNEIRLEDWSRRSIWDVVLEWLSYRVRHWL